MKEGWFIRRDTGESFPIHEHERDIRDPTFARRLGISEKAIKNFRKYVPVRDRIPFLRALLKDGVIRVRGRGIFASVEHWSDDNDNAMVFRAVHKWGQTVGAGPCLMLCITNLKTGERVNLFWLVFDEAMKAGQPFESVPVEVSER